MERKWCHQTLSGKFTFDKKWGLCQKNVPETRKVHQMKIESTITCRYTLL